MFHMKQLMTTTSIVELLNTLHKRDCEPILIVGDVMLDHYQYGKVERISPEAPVPIVNIKSEEFKLGGAANVANNITKLKGTTYLIGVIGDDLNGDVLLKLLNKNKIPNTLLKKKDYFTTTKTRIIAKSQQLLRIDKEQIHHDFSYHLTKIVQKFLPEFKIIIISDYGKGAIGKSLIDMLCSSSALVLIDPKERNFKNYRKPFIMTPNKKEAEDLSGIHIDTKESLLKAGEIIIEKTGTTNLLITLGEQGMVLFENKGKLVLHLPALTRKVYDVTGAGDTVLSALALGLSKKMSLIESCIFANICAGIVVGKMGTSYPEWQEIFDNSNKWKKYLQIKPWKEDKTT